VRRSASKVRVNGWKLRRAMYQRGGARLGVLGTRAALVSLAHRGGD